MTVLPTTLRKALLAFTLATLPLALAACQSSPPPEPAKTERTPTSLFAAQSAAKQGNYDEAIRLYTLSIEQGDTLFAAYAGRGLTYYRMKQFPAAVDDYTQALAIDPNSSVVLRNRCFALLELRQWEQADQDCQASAALEPNRAQSADTVGYVYLRQGRYSQAIEHFNQAIAMDPNYGPAYMHRGMAYYGLSDRTRGREDLLRARDLMPDNPEVLAELQRMGLEP